MSKDVHPTDLIAQLNWVLDVAETDRPQATHTVQTRLSIITLEGEVRELQNCGVEVEAIGSYTDHTTTIYISC